MPDEEVKIDDQTTLAVQTVVQPADDGVIQQPSIEIANEEVVEESPKEEIKTEPIVEVLSSEQAVQETPVLQIGGEEVESVETSPSPLLRKERTEVTASEAQPEQQKPEVVERIVEKVIEKPLTQEDREKIYREELTKHIPGMNAKKHEQYERHLLEIVNFIHEKHTLVSNQEIEDGLKIPDATVTRRLNQLIQRGIVTRIGDDKHAKYRLTTGV